MTREEMINFGELYLKVNPASKSTEKYKFVEKALELAKQEPCKVAIDKEKVFDILRRHHREAGRDVDGDIVPGDYTEHIYDEIKALQPVTPEPNYEDIAKAFQLGLLFGFGEKYDEMDRIIDEVKKVATPAISGNIDTIVPYLMHKEMDIPISECKKAYDVAIEYLRSQGRVKG